MKKTFFRYVIPSMVAFLFCGLYTMVDAFFVGRNVGDSGLAAINIAYPLVTQRLLEQMHGAGVAVNCWTCDDKKDAEELISWGVDYITSNILE